MENIGSDDAIIVENEVKGDWWVEKDSSNIDPFLEEEFKENHPNSSISLLNFDNFYLKYLDEIIDSNDSKIEINKFRNNLNDYLFSNDIIKLIESDFYDKVTEDEINKCFIGETINGGSICALYNVDITDINVEKDKFFPSYDSSDGTINIKTNITVYLELVACEEYDKETMPNYYKVNAKLILDATCIYDLFLNKKIISAKIQYEKHKMLDSVIISYSEYENDEYDECDDNNIGQYGNCTECSVPINDDNYGDGTLCHHCFISKNN